MQFPGIFLSFISIIYSNTKLTQAEVFCDGRVSLVIAMDSSSSLTSIQFLQIKNFTANGLVKRFMYPHTIATVAFAENVEIVTDFGELNSDKIMMYNSNRNYQTRIDYAIGNMTDMLSSSPFLDPDVPKVALILTDGKSTSGIELLHSAAMYADRNNVYVMAVGVGEERNLSPAELNNMTHGIQEHQKIIPYKELASSLDKVVEQICYLSQNGAMRTGEIRGRYLLTIVFDVTIQSLDLTKEFISRLLEYIEFGNPSMNLIIATLADGAASIGRFDETASLIEVRKFLDHMTTRDHEYFDAVLAYKKVESDFLYAPGDSSKMALFITDKPLHKSGFAYTRVFLNSKSKSSNVQIMYLGIGSAVNPDFSLALASSKVANRIIVSNQSLLSSGLNNIVRAIGTELLKYPVPRNVNHRVFHGPAEILIGYSLCPHSFNPQKFNKYNTFLENVVRNIHMGSDNVQLTLATYCTDVNYISSIKDYQVTFHVPYGLQRGGVITQLQWTTENVIREVLNVYDTVESDVKIAIVIIADPFMEGDLVGLLEEAKQNNILIMPLVLYHANASIDGLRQKVDTMNPVIPPLYISWSELQTHGAEQTMNVLRKYLIGRRKDILISASSMDLTDDLLKNYLKLYVRELQNINNKETTSSLERKIVSDIQQHRLRVLNDDVRNTHAGLHGILLSFLYSEDLSENRVGFLLTKGPSSDPSATHSVARLLKDANVHMFALGFGVDRTRDEELKLITGDNEHITKLSSAADIIGAISSVKKIMGSVNLDSKKATHISVALDSSLNVTDTDFKNLKVMINMFIKLWSSGSNYYLTFGQYNRDYNPEFVRQPLNQNTLTEVMQRVYTLTRQSPSQTLSQDSLPPRRLPLHLTIRNLHQRMKESKSQNRSQAVLMMFDKEPTDILLTDIALREARLDGVHFITIPIGIDSYPDTFTYNLPLYALGDVGPDAMNIINNTIMAILPKGKFDLLIALDADSMVSNDAMHWMKVATQFITSGMAERFTKYGVVTFSDIIRNVIEYTDFQSQMLVSYLRSINAYTKHPSIQTKPSVIINKLHSLIDTTMSTAAKIGLILMDDDTDNDVDLESSATIAWSKGVNLMSIGVGTHTDKLELSHITKFKNDYYLQIEDWENLDTDGFSWAIQTFEKMEPLHLYVTKTNPAVTTVASTISTPDTTVILEECTGLVDIAFAMDASGSLTTEMFNAIKQTVANTVSNMKLSENDVRVRGVITFDDVIQEVAEDVSNKILLRELILGAVHTKGMTKIDLAIRRLTEYLESEPKRNARKIGVVITDGKSMKPQKTREAAAAAVKSNITMVAMGIGGPTDISYTELMDVANNVTDNFLWLKTLSSFLLNGTQVLHERICRVTEGRDLSTTAIPTLTTRNPYHPEELCARCQCVGRVIIPDPLDCSRYHICIDSRLDTSEHCDPNKFWDPNTKTCLPPMTANCQYDPCYLRPDGYNYTTIRLLDENRCDQFYTCLNGRTKKLCTCGERLEGNVLIHRKYDPLSDHCVDDTKGECFTLINLNDQKVTKPDTWVCNTRPALSRESYINIRTNEELKCPTNYIYSHEKCRCVVDIIEVKTDTCKADIDLQFNTRSIQLWNVTLKDGQGVFDGKTTMVSIRNMANHYAHDFAVKVSMKTPEYKDMLLFENSNCQETDLPSIRVHLKKINGLLGVVAEIKTAHGYVKLQLQSTALRYQQQTTLTLASKGHKVAMWTTYDDGNLRSAIRESDVTMALPAEPHFHCNSPLYLGRGVGNELSPFEGTVDYFQWFYNCLPADVLEYFDHA